MIRAHVISVPGYVTEEWKDAVKKLLKKLGVTVHPKDMSKFNLQSDYEHIAVIYLDEDVDDIFESLSLCDYLMSDQQADTVGGKSYSDLEVLIGKSGKDLDEFICQIYPSIPAPMMNDNLTIIENVYNFYKAWRCGEVASDNCTNGEPQTHKATGFGE